MQNQFESPGRPLAPESHQLHRSHKMVEIFQKLQFLTVLDSSIPGRDQGVFLPGLWQCGVSWRRLRQAAASALSSSGGAMEGG